MSLNTTQKKLIAILDVFKQPETFILEHLPQVYTSKSFNELSVKDLKSYLSQLQEDLNSLFVIYINLIKRLASYQKDALLKFKTISDCTDFNKIEPQASLSKYWKAALNALSDEVLTFPFNEKTLMLVNRINQMNENASNQFVVENIADALTGANPKSWSEKGESLFELNIRSAILEIEQIIYLKSQGNNQLVTISKIGSAGNPSIRQIVKSNLDVEILKSFSGDILSVLKKLDNREINAVLLQLLDDINSDEINPTKITNKTSIGEAWG